MLQIIFTVHILFYLNNKTKNYVLKEVGLIDFSFYNMLLKGY